VRQLIIALRSSANAHKKIIRPSEEASNPDTFEEITTKSRLEAFGLIFRHTVQQEASIPLMRGTINLSSYLQSLSTNICALY